MHNLLIQHNKKFNMAVAICIRITSYFRKGIAIYFYVLKYEFVGNVH